jgi:hypothetical protein
MYVMQLQENIKSLQHQFEYYKLLANKTIAQLTEEALFWKPNEESNSIAIIIQHMHGNMLSRWTDFLTTDGEKLWRNRDGEFEEAIHTKAALLKLWEQGWQCLFNALATINETNINIPIYIRNQEQTVMEAIYRQLAHYPYHVGQIVYIGKMVCEGNWQSLSIPKGNSQQYNQEKFANKQKMNFMEDLLKSKDNA